MKTLTVVIPVILTILLGFFLARKKILGRSGIDDIKTLVSRVLLPVAIFNALGTAEYSGRTFLMIGVMLLMEIATFAIGFCMKPLFREPYRRYVPFLVSIYEGGMLAYPLYMNLVGAEHLSKIAMLDISGSLFGFSVWMGMLVQQENHEKVSPRALARTAFHTPAFIATILGVVCGLTGVIKLLTASPAGPVYSAGISFLTTPLNALILLAIGYDLAPEGGRIVSALKAVLCRLVLQAAACAAVLFATARVFAGDPSGNSSGNPSEMILVMTAVMAYMSVPTTFSMQAYVKDEEGSRFVSTTNSIYALVTIVLYVFITAWFHGAGG